MPDRTAEDMAQDREIASLKNVVANLQARLDAVDDRSHTSADRLKTLEDDPRLEWVQTHEARITDLEGDVAKLSPLESLIDHVDRLVGHVARGTERKEA